MPAHPMPTGHDHAESFQYLAQPTTEADGTVITNGYPKTGFYTHGAGSWSQAGDGGYGLPSQYSFSKYTNVRSMFISCY